MPQPSKSTLFERFFGKAGRDVPARVNGESWKAGLTAGRLLLMTG
jgi:hypothetical protein